ncbi:protein FAR1-RELATED SEQUENCE 9-like [Hordeum vulgare subsp. vulgare]|uniref:protein FAR1-RELATED SEQUENCE 9-like n=1 Tax=Hordeum vulgare subsp. vulgare TaxID=112509 RepID=UPI001D1A4140|nr:protein FAR1-RELATED SEQUENCE 9-like [Hordeum vulgare subsp. vulgare]
MAHHIARQMVGSDANLADRARPSFSAPSAFGELPPRAGSSSWFTNPSVVFLEPTSSRSRQQNSENVTEGEGSYVEDSEGLLFAEDASQYDSDDGDVSSQPLPPYVGMVFDTVDDARKFYNDYAFKLGFGTHISTSKFTQKRGQKKEDATLIKRVFGCVHARKPVKTETNSSSESIATRTSNSSRQPSEGMDVTRKRQKNRMPERVRYYRSHRSIPSEDYQLLLTLHDVNLSNSECMSVLGRIHGGDTRILPYVKRDVTNERAKLRKGLTFRDMDMTVKYFERRKGENPEFFFAKQQDPATNSVTALFWVDGRTRALYPKYKDCVFFDTTFCTNRYNMPFAPIVGVNNHLQTIALGCALLPDETIDTFKWVFQQWMVAMDNEHPTNIMIDQDQAMATAIDQVFPNTCHRCCKFHVLSNARSKLGRLLSRDGAFADVFYTCINQSETVEEFEETWQHMLHCFEVAENRHLKNMWRTRCTWAPAYFKDKFFPFTSTTGRSEGLNSYFKTLIRPADSVWRFVQQYEMCQETMLDREDNAGFTGETTAPPLYSRYNIEGQAAAYYTRTVFGKFQKQVTASTGFIVNQGTDYQGQGVVFELKATSYENPKLYFVHAVKDEGLFECSCHYFEMNGLICAHIIRAMVHLNVQAIPQQYLLERWSEAATTSMGRTGRLLDFGHPSTNTLKYNSLCRRLTWLASNACCNDDAYRILDDAIKALEPAIAAAKRGATPDQQATQHSEPPTPPAATTVTVNGDMPQRERSDMLQNPARVPKKGRPTDREKRKKTLVEQRDDEQKKKMKQQGKKATTSDKTTAQKRTVRCKHCNELGHNIQTCGTLKAAMEAAAAPSKCQFCSGIGHAVPECQYLRAVMANDQRVAQMTQLNL